MDYNNDYKNDIIASLLSLKLRGYIDTTDNTITVINKDTSKLSKNEKYIMDTTKFIFSSNEFRQRWKALIIEEAKDNGFIKQRKKIKIPYYETIMPFYIILLFGFSLFSIFSNMFVSLTICLYIIFIGLVIIMFSMQYLEYIVYKDNKYVRTTKGYELYTKLLGLKNFIKDFSIMDKRNQEELSLWKDYMIYAVIFKEYNSINKDIYKQFTEMRDIEIKYN